MKNIFKVLYTNQQNQIKYSFNNLEMNFHTKHLKYI